MLPAVLATAVALGACDSADATLPETEAVPAEFRLSAEDLKLSAQELELLCGDTTGLDTSDGEEPPTSGDGLQQPDPGRPNEPAGFRTILEHASNTLPSDPSNPWNWRTTGNLSLVRDALGSLFGNEGGDEGVTRVRIRAGMDGVASHNQWYRFPSDQSDFSELYVAVWYKFPEDWVNHAVTTKQLWPRFHNHNNSPFTAFQGPKMTIRVALQGERWGPRSLLANTGPGSYRSLEAWRDEWVLLEYHFKMNTTNHSRGDTSKADGIVRAWMTAGGETHQVIDYDDVKFLQVDGSGNYVGKDGRSSTGKFTVIQWNPTYGGKGRPAPRDMSYYVGPMYVSGRP